MSSSTPTYPSADPSPVAPIASFWRRTLAFLLDILLIWVVGYSLGGKLGVWLARLGGWGPLVGFGIVLGYFGVLNSRIGKGQTLGKRLLQVQVVGADGEWISVRSSLSRTGILTGSRFLGAMILDPFNGTLTNTLVVLVTTLLDVGTLYFYLFNRPTRQGMHDLLARTCVVRHPAGVRPALPPPARVHVAICAALVLLSVGFWWVLATGIAFKDTAGVYAVSGAVTRFPEVRTASGGLDFHYEGRKKTYQAIQFTVLLKDPLSCSCAKGRPEGFRGKPGCTCSPVQHSGVPLGAPAGPNRPGGGGYGYDPGASAGSTGDGIQSADACACSPDSRPCPCDTRNNPGCPCAVSALAERVAAVALDIYPAYGKQDQLAVQIGYGYNIGLSSGLVGYPVIYTLSPEEWRKRLEEL